MNSFKVSTGDHSRLKYLGGIDFWEKNQWWEKSTDGITYGPETKAWGRAFLERLREEELNKRGFNLAPYPERGYPAAATNNHLHSHGQKPDINTTPAAA